MKYTVTANCRHGAINYTLRHDGNEWTEGCPYEESIFCDREHAEAFADFESECFDVRHEMIIHEFDDNSNTNENASA